MKWTYWPPNTPSGWAETWQLGEDEVPKRGLIYKLCLVHYPHTKVWTVYAERIGVGKQGKIIGTLPYDTPEEELKALAIAMWRLG